MQSLRDKLLQAGLVTKEQAERSAAPPKVERPPPRSRPEPQRSAPVPAPESEKDRERRLNRELAEKQKQIRSICDAGEVMERGEQTFFFRTRRRELRRFHLTPDQVAALERGDLAIVDRPNGQEHPHALVPRAFAESILALEVKAIRFWARSKEEGYGFEEESAPLPEGAEAAPAGEEGEEKLSSTGP